MKKQPGTKNKSSLRLDIEYMHEMGMIVNLFDRLPLNPIIRKKVHFMLDKIGRRDCLLTDPLTP